MLSREIYSYLSTYIVFILLFVDEYDILSEKRVIFVAGAKAIKQLLIERKMTVKSLAEKLGIEPQSMRTKLYRDTFSHAEIIKIADILNADVQIITRDTRKVF